MSDIDIFSTTNRYSVIYADPPWNFKTRSDKGAGRSASQHYAVPDLSTLTALPVGSIAARDSALLLWVTDPHLQIGMNLMEDWGFTYKTVGFYWAKQNKIGDGFFTGMGYYTRANPEMCLLGTRGNPKRIAKDVKKLIVAKRREHSRKPEEARSRIERLFSGPYLEMFARSTKSGWDAWGNQTTLFDNRQ